MKIVHVCLAFGYTNDATYQENYLAKFHKLNGHDVTVLSSCYSNEKGKITYSFPGVYYDANHVKIIRVPYIIEKLPFKINNIFGHFRKIEERIEEISPDIIFIHNLQFCDIGCIKKYVTKHTNVKVFADNHADFSNSARNFWTRNILYKLYWRVRIHQIRNVVDTFWGVTPSRVDFLTDIYGLPKEKCKLLVMGADDFLVNQLCTDSARDRIREKYGINASDFLIVSGGKIDSFKKQTIFLMEAVREIQSDRIRLIIFGSIEDALKEKVFSLVDGHKIQYIGWASEKESYEYFNAADMVVFPGRHSVYWEEVTAIGIPMICKYWDGTTHIDLGNNVRFLYEDNKEEISKSIMGLLYDEESYETMKKAARSECKKQFLYGNISQKAIGENK